MRRDGILAKVLVMRERERYSCLSEEREREVFLAKVRKES